MRSVICVIWICPQNSCANNAGSILPSPRSQGALLFYCITQNKDSNFQYDLSAVVNVRVDLSLAALRLMTTHLIIKYILKYPDCMLLMRIRESRGHKEHAGWTASTQLNVYYSRLWDHRPKKGVISITWNWWALMGKPYLCLHWGHLMELKELQGLRTQILTSGWELWSLEQRLGRMLQSSIC